MCSCIPRSTLDVGVGLRSDKRSIRLHKLRYKMRAACVRLNIALFPRTALKFAHPGFRLFNKRAIVESNANLKRMNGYACHYSPVFKVKQFSERSACSWHIFDILDLHHLRMDVSQTRIPRLHNEYINSCPLIFIYGLCFRTLRGLTERETGHSPRKLIDEFGVKPVGEAELLSFSLHEISGRPAVIANRRFPSGFKPGRSVQGELFYCDNMRIATLFFSLDAFEGPQYKKNVRPFRTSFFYGTRS